MKLLITSFLLIAFISTTLWSCKTYWDVEPKVIYSPVDLDKGYSVSFVSKPGFYGSLTAKFIINSAYRKDGEYGFLMFTELSQLLGQLKDVQSKNSLGKLYNYSTYARATIKTDSVIGTISANSIQINSYPQAYPTFYLLPTLNTKVYDGKDSIYTNYYSDKYLQVQLSPWVKKTLLFPDNNFGCLFEAKGSLYYVTNTNINSELTDGVMYFYKFDSLANIFVQTNSIVSTNLGPFELTCCESISKIIHVFYNESTDQYHMYVHRGAYNWTTKRHGSTIGEVILDNNFRVVASHEIPGVITRINNYTSSFEAFSEDVEFKKVYRQGDTLHVLHTYPISGKSSDYTPDQYSILKNRLTRSAISLSTGKILFSYTIDKPYNNDPSTVIFLRSDILMRTPNSNGIIRYGRNGFKRYENFPPVTYMPIFSYAVEQNNAAYLYVDSAPGAIKDPITGASKGKMANLFKVSLNTSNEVIYQDMGLTIPPFWAYYYFKQGLINNGELTLLSNISEVWQLNLARTAIDINKPYIEVKPTNR